MLISDSYDQRTETDNKITTECGMPKTLDNRKFKLQINLMDAFMYLLAGSAMAIISVSFLLWLRF